MRPTRRAALLFALAIPFATALIALAPSWWLASLYFPATLLALMVADVGMVLPPGDVRSRTTSPVRLFVGRPGAVEVRVDAETRAGDFEIAAILEVAGDVEEPQETAGLVRNGTARLELPLVPRRRGTISIRALWLRWAGPLGLVEVRRRRSLRLKVDIVPDVRGVREAALNFDDRNVIYGMKSQRPHGEGTEFDKLAEYHTGMDSRFIDWKRSARHRKLLCRQFRQERNHRIVLAFDTGHLMMEAIDGMPRLDHAVRAGMLLGWVSLRHGDLVGGCGFAASPEGYLQPGRGMPYFNRLQHFAAGLDYRAEETNYTHGLTDLGARLRQRALVVVFSEFVDSISAELLIENLQIMVRKHVVVFAALRDPALSGLRDLPPDTFARAARAVIADDFLREREAVLERIARLGVHCLDVGAADLTAALLNRYLTIKQEGLL